MWASFCDNWCSPYFSEAFTNNLTTWKNTQAHTEPLSIGHRVNHTFGNKMNNQSMAFFQEQCTFRFLIWHLPLNHLLKHPVMYSMNTNCIPTPSQSRKHNNELTPLSTLLCNFPKKKGTMQWKSTSVWLYVTCSKGDRGSNLTRTKFGWTGNLVLNTYTDLLSFSCKLLEWKM